MNDKLGNEIKSGNYIAWSVRSGNQTRLRIGKVAYTPYGWAEVTAADNEHRYMHGNLLITDFVLVNKGKRITLRHGGRLVILDAKSIPEQLVKLLK